MNTRKILFFCGCLLLALSLACLVYVPFVSYSSTSVLLSKDKTHQASTNEQEEEYLKIDISCPERMEKDYSYSVIVSLSKLKDLSESTKRSLGINIEGKSETKAAVEHYIPTYYEGEKNFTAKLSANNIDSILNSPEWQLLDDTQRKVEWRWNVAPKQYGQQTINISVQSKTSPKDEEKTGRVVWANDFNVSINKPWISKDGLSISSILSGVIGAGFTIPWIFERIRERRRKKYTPPKIGFIK